jgi:hypothetical protein
MGLVPYLQGNLGLVYTQDAANIIKFELLPAYQISLCFPT